MKVLLQVCSMYVGRFRGFVAGIVAGFGAA